MRMCSAIVFPGYQITEQLYAGSRTLVYRAIHQVDDQPVVIKLLKNEHPSFSELVQFRNQYTIAKNLEVPGIIQPFSLDPYGNGYILVMEDFGGVSLRQWLNRQVSFADVETQRHGDAKIENQPHVSLSDFFSIALQLIDTLHLLHQQRIIHKDLKPANILIHPETQQVKLIDFSIASLLPRETQEIQNPKVMEGTLAYLSPEQTGRMNRGIDYRSDFYSLGITFFELLTGQLPFQSCDLMELVHCHLAKQPPSICDINPELPLMLGNIICKLMAKNAEDRYQSAIGLKYDLMKCQEEWHITGKHSWFELGQRDVSDRFLIPEKLYGREAEVQSLLEAFGRVANGASELMLVAGFSGIGKTAVVNEVHKPIVRWNGYFIKGKYDQFNRSIPFSAFVQAFRDLMAQLLNENDEQLAQWRTKILQAVGENGQVLLEVIPELEQIIGKQPASPELSGSAAQNRFNLLFQKFIRVFATLEHPLVIFLDDLQWADLASLNLLKLLMNEGDRGYLFIIGAYRDNEVFPAHPLMLMLDEITQTQATVSTVALSPLSQLDINHLLAETLSCSVVLALPLTELVYQKTKGNPFFTTQFLKSLYEEGYIAFDLQAGHWQCDMATVRSLALTDDVVEFMAIQLQKLPTATQAGLKLAACLGNQFDLQTLAIVGERSLENTAADLWRALQEGLVLPTSEVYKFYQADSSAPSTTSAETLHNQPTVAQKQATALSTQQCTYRFLHDRVQQAAYSLIPASEKKAAHLKIGQLLLQNTSSEAIETSIFDVVNQLNAGIEIITQQLEKNELAQLNLVAGRKAKISTAYKAAVEYFAAGIKLLPENSWQTHYRLTLDLYRERAECEYLTGNLNVAENLFDLALNQAQDKFDKADIYAIQMYLKMTQGEDIQAGFEAGLKGLSILGMHLPLIAEAQQDAITSELNKLHTKLATVSPAALFDLPEMTDPVNKVCMSLLADLWAITYMGGHLHLPHLSMLLMINTSLTYGNAAGSGFAYCLYGMSLANQGDYQTAYEFGTLALKLDRHFNSTKFIYKTNNIFAHTINPYNQHLKTNLPLSRQSYQTSQEGGDVVFGVWAVSFLIWAMLVKGDRLPDVYAETEKYLSYVQQVNDVNMLYAFTLQRQFLLNLQDPARYTDLLDDQNPDGRNERDIPYIDIWRQKQNFEHGINWYCFLKLQLSYFYGRYEDAVEAAVEAEPTLPANAGFFPIIQYYFYYPLSLTALYSAATPEDKNQYWSILQQHQQVVKKWADCCPENFLHRYLLLAAEIAQISGNSLEASDLYDRAITTARANEYIHEAALANELAAKFYLKWNKERIAQEYMTDAYYGYAQWGAKAKVADLESRYPKLLAPILQQSRPTISVNETVFASSTVTSSNSSSSISDALDLTSVLKASQTLSREMDLGKLLAALLQLIIENAGADKCVLLLMQDDLQGGTKDERLLVKGLAILGAEPVVLQRTPVEESQDIPQKLIYHVKNRLEPVVLIDATADTEFAHDPYFLRQRPKSILCSPILHQGKLLGMVYLENNSMIGAFTSDRAQILNLLCAQATISLENARLYEQVQQALENAKLMQFSIDRVSTPVCWVEPDARISYANDAFCRDIGYSHEEIRSKYVYDLNASFSKENWSEHWQLTKEQGSMTFESNLCTREGRYYPVELTINHMTFQEHEYHLAFMVNISDRKQAESAILQKSQELEQALQDLQQAQLQIVQSEKMSALGNLVAGVAHEINNPVGFIAGNLQPALDYVKDTFGLIDLYQQEYPNPSAVIQQEVEAIDLNYVREDLPKLIDSMKLGVDRIRSISTSLRTFSRADKDYKVPFNIHEGIDSTILILKHRLKANGGYSTIDVITDYGTVPVIECFPGQLNQVFMNILANAIDALEEKMQSCASRSAIDALEEASQKPQVQDTEANPNYIEIQTRLDAAGQQVVIRIRDNGVGMTDEVKQQVFDHLFTTKAVGKGTGLGLAIAYQIVVEKHAGAIKVNSTVGMGTEFVITLPVKTNNADGK
jgi:PAS domain S-box-containing protein